MAKKKMKQVHGMQQVMSPEKQWDIVKRFDGEKNPFGGKSRRDIEEELREMSLDSMQRYATQLEIMPTNNIRILKTKILQKYDKYSRGLNRAPIQVSHPMDVTKKPRVAKRLKENLQNFAV